MVAMPIIVAKSVLQLPVYEVLAPPAAGMVFKIWVIVTQGARAILPIDYPAVIVRKSLTKFALFYWVNFVLFVLYYAAYSIQKRLKLFKRLAFRRRQIIKNKNADV